MDSKKIIYTIKGGDNNGWALDQTLFYVKNAFEEKTNWIFSKSIRYADVVIFGWYNGFLENRYLLNKNQIKICILDNDTNHIYKNLLNDKYISEIKIWLTHSTKEKKILREQGYDAFIMPYVKKINPINKIILNKEYTSMLDSIERYKKDFKKKLIVSIQRDSSFINKEWIPKKQKNPQYLLDLYKESIKQNLNYILVICGTRRHWITKELDRLKLPYLFLGRKPYYLDDYLEKIPRDLILEIIKKCDYSIVTSNWEGGPLCIIESLEVGKACISTNVGFSQDLLSNELLLKGKLKEDLIILKNILSSESRSKIALRNSLEKYESYKSLDLELIIDKILYLSNKKNKNSNKYFTRLNIYLFDRFINLIENITIRSISFIKRKLSQYI